jgi:hypothetical protein
MRNKGDERPVCKWSKRDVNRDFKVNSSNENYACKKKLNNENSGCSKSSTSENSNYEKGKMNTKLP